MLPTTRAHRLLLIILRYILIHSFFLLNMLLLYYLFALVCLSPFSSALFPPTPDLSVECLSCQALVGSLNLVFSNETTVQMMLAKIDEKCAGKSEWCTKIGDTLVAIPVGIFEGLADLAWPIPLGLCATINVCTVDCCSSRSPPEQIHLSLASADRYVCNLV